MREVLTFAVLTASTQAIDNNLGLRPPMGWRSWNCYGLDVDDAKMRATVDALLAPRLTTRGTNTTLAALGYSSAGLDDGYQKCGAGVEGSFHTAAGAPIVDDQRFPHGLKSLVDYAHDRDIKMGWYANNCQCRETGFPYVEAHYRGDVAAMHAADFDGIKLDDCGQFQNLTKWERLINATRRAVLIENWCEVVTNVAARRSARAPCYSVTLALHTLLRRSHWGNDLPHIQSDGSLWCPFNLYRTSRDVDPSWASILYNLWSTTPFQDPKAPLSRPGCWACKPRRRSWNHRLGSAGPQKTGSPQRARTAAGRPGHARGWQHRLRSEGPFALRRVGHRVEPAHSGRRPH